MTGVLGVALLTYCGVQTGGNSGHARESRLPATVPSDDPPGQTAVCDPAAGVRGGQLQYIPASDSHAELQGTATIGSWRSDSDDIHGQVILHADAGALDALFDRIQAPASNAQSGGRLLPLTFPVHGPPIGDISLPAMSLRGGSSGMDRDMHNALKAAQHPVIEFVYQQLRQATVQWGGPDRLGRLNLRIVGTLAMAGVVRPVAMDLIVSRDAQRHIHVQAQTLLLMSDFGVTPPVALFGLIKADNQVRVIFDLDLVPTQYSLAMRSPAQSLADAQRR